MNLLINGNAKRIPLADKSVNLIFTSPPYFGLRSYKTSRWVGGDPFCEHVKNPNATKKMGNPEFIKNRPSREATKMKGYYYEDVCEKCGAVRVDEQIGLEDSIEEYVQSIVEISRELWRVLRDDGIYYLNIADSYAGGKGQSGSGGADRQRERHNKGESINTDYQTLGGKKQTRPTDNRAMLRNAGIKPKDLCMIPARVALALQADGWYVRRDIVWAKGCSGNYMGGSTMPESTKDRPTSSHEYIYMFTKSAKYYYDYYGQLEDALYDGRNDTEFKGSEKYSLEAVQTVSRAGGERWPNQVNGERKRNRRSVWVYNPGNYKGSHYAAFPMDIVEPAILAGCPPKVCAKCGAPWERVVESKASTPGQNIGYNARTGTRNDGDRAGHWVDGKSETIGWRPTCDCNADTRPGIVLDPFIGSGTTAMVARKHGCKAIGLDLSFEYLNKNARERLVYGDFVYDKKGNKQFTMGV
jgi:DNA modification methylase